MRYAIVTEADRKGTETGEAWLLLNKREQQVVYAAMKKYCEENKRGKKFALALFEQMDNTLAIF